MLELIPPVSGRSLFSDFLDRQSNGGVQHVAYTVPESEFDPAVTRMKNEQYDVMADALKTLQQYFPDQKSREYRWARQKILRMKDRGIYPSGFGSQY